MPTCCACSQPKPPPADPWDEAYIESLAWHKDYVKEARKVLDKGGFGTVWRCQAAGLEGFGRPQAYVARQIERWSRQYVASNTGDVPEIRALPDIDVAFLSMNLPFTMNWLAATNVIRRMRPKVVYP